MAPEENTNLEGSLRSVGSLRIKVQLEVSGSQLTISESLFSHLRAAL
jgi:hypothetical protein